MMSLPAVIRVCPHNSGIRCFYLPRLLAKQCIAGTCRRILGKTPFQDRVVGPAVIVRVNLRHLPSETPAEPHSRVRHTVATRLYTIGLYRIVQVNIAHSRDCASFSGVKSWKLLKVLPLSRGTSHLATTRAAGWFQRALKAPTSSAVQLLCPPQRHRMG